MATLSRYDAHSSLSLSSVELSIIQTSCIDKQTNTLHNPLVGSWYNPTEMRKQRSDLTFNKYAQRMRSKPSPIERPVKKVLQDLSINFMEQHILKPYIVDFFLPDLKIVIECDGMAFHQDHEREIRRDKHVVSMGYRVLHIPGWICKQPVPLVGFIRDFISAGDSAPIDRPGESDTVTSKAV